MKKSTKYKILSILFCFMFLFVAACDGGPLGDDDPNTQSLDGVKVLSKPADYSFSDAVGVLASENYYNLFAKEVLNGLYSIYNDMSYVYYKIEIFFNEIDGTNGQTYPFESDNSAKYYLYDSLRYTITKVETTKDESGMILSQTIYLDENSAWDWTLKKNSEGYETIFNQLTKSNADYFALTENKFEVKQAFFDYYECTDWTYLFSRPEYIMFIPSYAQYYTGEKVKSADVGEIEVINYWTSPYYQKIVEGETEADLTAVNFYQDALEYATYLIVLGYDYVDANQNPTADAPLFDFETVYDADGLITDVKVGGWENEKISIVDALGRVKKMYQELGNFVGVTETNKEQLERFVLDKVIGQQALAKNIFTIDMVENISTEGVSSLSPTQPDDLTFNRNYMGTENTNGIVENVIDYACSQAPIGYDASYDNGDGTFGKKLGLDDSYVASQITDYSGDYFFASYDDNDDSKMFQYIQAAEYQSMVLFPQAVDLGKPLTDIWLAFEYYENPTQDLVMADSIKINVGFRYFNSSANGGKGELFESEPYQIEVKNAKNGEVSGQKPDVNWVYIGASEKDTSNYDIVLPTDLTINTQFNNDIGEGVINPFVESTELVPPSYSSKVIAGTDDARKYYKLNQSSTYGSYGTLNEQMFSVETAGEDACDFMEIYFDTVKQKGVTGISYNFKVALILYATEAPV